MYFSSFIFNIFYILETKQVLRGLTILERGERGREREEWKDRERKSEGRKEG